MGEYSPKRRTALVFHGTGTAGAYHAGVLKALDENGIKIDVVVGSGIGALSAVFAAVAGGPRLYGPGGFWEGVGRRALWRLRLGARLGLLTAGMAFAVFLLPVLGALLAGILVVPILIIDLIAPGFASRLLLFLDATPEVLRGLYLSALAVPSFLFALCAGIAVAWALLRDRRRALERLEFLVDVRRARARLFSRLWEVVQGTVLAAEPASDADFGKRVVALISDSLGQPGFRELVLRVTDLDSGAPAAFVVLGDEARATLTSVRGRSHEEAGASVVDLRAPGYAGYLTDALMAGLLAPLLAPLRRVTFPKGGPVAGGTRRFTDATLLSGCGLGDAFASGAEQVVLVTATPRGALAWNLRRGPWAVLSAMLGALERSALETELAETERLNRIVETVGQPLDDGRRAWQDPVTGRIYRAVDVYLIRPEKRSVGPLDFDGARDAASEVVETVADLVEHGYTDAHRQFLDPVVGASAPTGTPVRGFVDRPVRL
jgi:hypothetical protein